MRRTDSLKTSNQGFLLSMETFVRDSYFWCLEGNMERYLTELRISNNLNFEILKRRFADQFKCSGQTLSKEFGLFLILDVKATSIIE